MLTFEESTKYSLVAVYIITANLDVAYYFLRDERGKGGNKQKNSSCKTASWLILEDLDAENVLKEERKVVKVPA